MYSSNAFDGATSSNEMHTRRRECIRAHLHKCHNIECRPGDMTLIACVACPPFNGQPTYVEKGAFPEHINQWHWRIEGMMDDVFIEILRTRSLFHDNM